MVSACKGCPSFDGQSSSPFRCARFGILFLQGKRGEAIAVLRDAVEHGLGPGLLSQIAEDEDFNSLHGDLRFEALVAKIKKPAAESQP